MILENIVCGKAKLRIATALFKSSYTSLSKLASACGLSKRVTYQSLLELEKFGVVRINRKSKNWEISIIKSRLTDSIKKLVELEEVASVNFVVDHLSKKKIKSIVWFGSTQKNTASPSSDLDLAVVSELPKYQTYKLLRPSLAELEKSLRREIHLEIVYDKSRSRDFLLKGVKVYG